MPDIIKTWPGFMEPRKIAQIFSEHSPPFARYFFSLGRGRPKACLDRLWFTYRGRILGSLSVWAIVRNDGSLPKLNRLDGEPSEWQFKPDVWVALCKPPMRRLRQRVYFGGFRGWRYFDFETYRKSVGAKIRI